MRSKESNMRGFLADYFTIKMMAEEARRNKLDLQPGIKEKIANFENRLLVELAIEQYIAQAKRPDFEALAREAYLVENSLFQVPERVRAEHILFAVNEGQTEQEALNKAENMYKRLLASKKMFAELAVENSDDSSVGANKGDLGFFQFDEMVEPFSRAAFSLKVGELSKPVKTSFGYHVIHLLDRQPAHKLPFERVRRKLIEQEEKKFNDRLRDEFIGKFRSSTEIKVDEEALSRFVKKMQATVN